MAGSEPAQNIRPSKEREAKERRLIEAAQSDPARFGEVYESYFALVYAYVTRRVRNRDEAEDLTAEVFRKALASLPRFKWRGAPFAVWLFRIASNMIADRSKRVAREVSLDEAGATERGSRAQISKGADTSQQKDLEDSERLALLFRLVDDLAEDQGRVLVMRFAEEKSIREIAEALGRSEGAVKQLQFRALENLRMKLHHRGHREEQ
ncbi:MAG TPA: sigma-70 family RNA polymerase sigma factor [Pyrinomonadaceae bacterium]|nr:sigma-70 family RNA polymerase sigma factor [Pyrinomonadaceae bacterium]